MKLKIEKMGINGEGIAYNRRTPVFIPNAFVSEEVEVEFTDKQPHFQRAQVTKLLKRSSHRVNSPCPYFRKCDGCALIALDIREQLKQKHSLLEQSMYKYARVPREMIPSIVENDQPLGYRNALKLPVKEMDGKLVTGLFAMNSNRLIQINQCVVHDELIENVRVAVLDVLNQHGLKEFNAKERSGIRTLVIRGFHGVAQMTLITGEDELSEELVQDLMAIPSLNSLWQSVHLDKKSRDVFGKKMKHIAGARTLELKLEDLVLRLSPRSFFQLNTNQAVRIYKQVRDYVAGANHMVEAYSGIGAISMFCHDVVRNITGIEIINDAVKNAKENAKLNKIDNCEFVCGDAPQELKRVSQKQKIDVIVVDPPRSGLSQAMVQGILKSRPRKIVYISCNPSTLGKNILELSDRYELIEVTPYDLFSNTPHVETVVLLRRVD